MRFNFLSNLFLVISLMTLSPNLMAQKTTLGSSKALLKLNCGGPVTPKGYYIQPPDPCDTDPNAPGCNPPCKPGDPKCDPCVIDPSGSKCNPCEESSSIRPGPGGPDGPCGTGDPRLLNFKKQNSARLSSSLPAPNASLVDGTEQDDTYVLNGVRMKDTVVAAYYAYDSNQPMPHIKSVTDTDLERYRKIIIKCEDARRKIIKDNWASFNLNTTYLGWDTDWMYSQTSIEPYFPPKTGLLCSIQNQPCSTDTQCCSNLGSRLTCDPDLRSCQPVSKATLTTIDEPIDTLKQKSRQPTAKPRK